MKEGLKGESLEDKGIKLEVFVDLDCESTNRALSVAKAAVGAVEGVNLEVRYFDAHRKRARDLGVFMVPAFVINGEVFSIGEPNKEDLIKGLYEGLKGKG